MQLLDKRIHRIVSYNTRKHPTIHVHEPAHLQPRPLHPLVDHKRRPQRQHVAARPDGHAVRPPLDHPPPDPRVIVRHGEPVERQPDRPRRTRREVAHFLKRAQQTGGMGYLGRLRHRHVHLHDLGSGDRTGVGDRDGDAEAELALGDDGLAQFEVGKRIGGVRETVSACECVHQWRCDQHLQPWRITHPNAN